MSTRHFTIYLARYSHLNQACSSVNFFKKETKLPILITLDCQVFADFIKVKHLIMSVFHSVPGVPREKMERQNKFES